MKKKVSFLICSTKSISQIWSFCSFCFYSFLVLFFQFLFFVVFGLEFFFYAFLVVANGPHSLMVFAFCFVCFSYVPSLVLGLSWSLPKFFLYHWPFICANSLEEKNGRLLNPLSLIMFCQLGSLVSCMFCFIVSVSFDCLGVLCFQA